MCFYVVWNSDDDRALIEKVKAISEANDKLSYKTRIKQIDWKEIAFKKYSPEDCEKRFNTHLKGVRRCRNLNEIVIDMEINLKKKRSGETLTAYHFFVKEQLLSAKTCGDFVSF